MSCSLVWLAFLMGVATYPLRAMPLLAPGADRLPPILQSYLRLVGPAVLAAVATVSLMIRLAPNRQSSLYVGPEWLALALFVLVVARWRNLLAGLVLAAALVAALRALGWAPLP